MTILCILIILLTIVLSVGYSVSQDVEAEAFVLSATNPSVTIVHVSDLHYPECFLSPEETARIIERESPDCILFTGDIANGKDLKEETDALFPFFQRLSAVPCFLTIGNHEIGSEELDYFVKKTEKAGITVLLNRIVTTRINGRDFAFIGLSDGYSYEEETFENIPDLQNKTRILLAHRPEGFPSYTQSDPRIRPHLVVSGHAHGGMIRVGDLALYAPDQGFFPKYTSGLYTQKDVSMVVSRGLGVSAVDFRCFNRYHLPVITI